MLISVHSKFPAAAAYSTFNPAERTSNTVERRFNADECTFNGVERKKGLTATAFRQAGN